MNKFVVIKDREEVGRSATIILPSGTKIYISMTDIDFTINVGGKEIYSEYKVNEEWLGEIK